MKQKIGFVGLGLMGGSLARHLLSAGFPVTAHDIISFYAELANV